MDSTTRRRELAAFLRSSRRRVDPRDHGFDPARRRVPGLRREEVATIAGVSLSWYTWLEQAREIHASPDVIRSIARALRLNPAEQDYLLRLSAHSAPARVRADGSDPRSDPLLLELTAGFLPNPASIVTPSLDYVAWNRASEQIVPGFLGSGGQTHNLARFLVAGGREHSPIDLPDPGVHEMAARLRTNASRHPDDSTLELLIEELRDTSREFARLWGLHDIRAAWPPPDVAFGHPDVGALRFHQLQLTPDPYPELTMVVFLPTNEATALRLDELSVN